MDPRAAQAGVAELVIPLALRRIGEDLVCLRRLFEPALGVGVVGSAVRVVLVGRPALSLLNLLG